VTFWHGEGGLFSGSVLKRGLFCPVVSAVVRLKDSVGGCGVLEGSSESGVNHLVKAIDEKPILWASSVSSIPSKECYSEAADSWCEAVLKSVCSSFSRRHTKL
jgi:hypothetical protein